MSETPLYKRLSFNKHGFLDASAGTGKTYTLENFIARLITESDVDVNQILVMTFTEKAAGEIKSRVRSRLYSDYQEAKTHNPDKAKILMNSWLAGDQMNIFTIHGFCQSISSEFAFENLSAMDLEMVEDSSVYKKMLQHVLENELPKIYGELLHPLLTCIKFDDQFEENIINILNNINSGLQLIPIPKEQEFKDFIPRIKRGMANKESSDNNLVYDFKVTLVRKNF